jgi:hypothetical protein
LLDQEFNFEFKRSLGIAALREVFQKDFLELGRV